MQTNEAGDKLVVGLADGVCLVYDYAMPSNKRVDEK